jgi:pilus assembly protein CpaB
MNRRLILILICALVGGGGASYLVFRMMGTRLTAPAEPAAEIVMATRDVQVGTLIGPPDLRMGRWLGTLPKGALGKMDAALNRGAIANIYEGEPVLADRLAATGAGGGLAAIIPTGLRATAVRVDEVVGLAGFVTPGMRVDVLMSGVPPGGSPAEGSRVTTLLQNIQVLSAGESLQKDAEGKARPVQVVNLLVTPEQAEKLTLASSQMRIQLVLRNPLDTETGKPAGARMSELFGISLGPGPRAPAPTLAGEARADRGKQGARRPGPAPAPAAPPPAPEETPAPKVHIVEVFNGAARSEARFTLNEIRDAKEVSQ